MLIDMRAMNHINQVDEHSVHLGRGNTWARVLGQIPPSKYTMVHGTCTSVGLGGFFTGLGINAFYHKYGVGAENLLDVTMVLANGDVVKTTPSNMTILNRGGVDIPVSKEQKLLIKKSEGFSIPVTKCKIYY